MNDHENETQTQQPQGPPPPPRPGPVPPTRTQLRTAAACVTALAYHHRSRLSEGDLPLVQPDLHWLLIAHVIPALHLVGLHEAPTAQRDVLRLVFSALRDAAVVRVADLSGYLESITIRQQQDLLALAHRQLHPGGQVDSDTTEGHQPEGRDR
jgi:hypothetical protein